MSNKRTAKSGSSLKQSIEFVPSFVVSAAVKNTSSSQNKTKNKHLNKEALKLPDIEQSSRSSSVLLTEVHLNETNGGDGMRREENLANEVNSSLFSSNKRLLATRHSKRLTTATASNGKKLSSQIAAGGSVTSKLKNSSDLYTLNEEDPASVNQLDRAIEKIEMSNQSSRVKISDEIKIFDDNHHQERRRDEDLMMMTNSSQLVDSKLFEESDDDYDNENDANRNENDENEDDDDDDLISFSSDDTADLINCSARYLNETDLIAERRRDFYDEFKFDFTGRLDIHRQKLRELQSLPQQQQHLQSQMQRQYGMKKSLDFPYDKGF